MREWFDEFQDSIWFVLIAGAPICTAIVCASYLVGTAYGMIAFIAAFVGQLIPFLILAAKFGQRSGRRCYERDKRKYGL
jgi:hypothetical protein